MKAPRTQTKKVRGKDQIFLQNPEIFRILLIVSEHKHRAPVNLLIHNSYSLIH